jgi:hypothetical protein
MFRNLGSVRPSIKTAWVFQAKSYFSATHEMLRIQAQVSWQGKNLRTEARILLTFCGG